MTDPRDVPALISATWPPEAIRRIGPFDVALGAGGGNRVTAARLADPRDEGRTVTETEIAAAMRAQEAAGQAPLFTVFDWQSPLDRTLDAMGFGTRDATDMLLAPCAALAEAPPPVSCFEIWPPLAVQEEIWAAGGIGPDRLAVMARAKGPKTALFGRTGDRPAGAAFIAVSGDVAMLHALEVAPRARRMGLARLMMRSAAQWALGQGAHSLAVLVTRRNAEAQGLYASLHLKPVGSYHYRMA